MADNKSGRDKQAQDQEQRQRERALAEELQRMDEPEPPVERAQLRDLETELDTLSFPAAGAAIVAAVGAHEVETEQQVSSVAELIPETDKETFESPAEVRERVQRPTVAASLKRIVEASETLQNVSLGDSQHDAYERTLQELTSIDAEDDDAGVEAITAWVLDRIHEKGKLPPSRGVRREAAKYCRKHGYSVRNDEWLGI